MAIKMESEQTPKRGRGKPAHKKTAQTQHFVLMLAAAGVDHETIARAVKLSSTTLRKHYRDELDNSKTVAVGRMAAALYSRGLRGNVTAQIFYLKTQGGWTTEAQTDGAQQRIPDIDLVIQAIPGGDDDGPS